MVNVSFNNDKKKMCISLNHCKVECTNYFVIVYHIQRDF